MFTWNTLYVKLDCSHKTATVINAERRNIENWLTQCLIYKTILYLFFSSYLSEKYVLLNPRTESLIRCFQKSSNKELTQGQMPFQFSTPTSANGVLFSFLKSIWVWRTVSPTSSSIIKVNLMGCKWGGSSGLQMQRRRYVQESVYVDVALSHEKITW